MTADMMARLNTPKKAAAARLNGHKGGRPGTFKRIEFRPEDHTYWKDGRQFPGVSSVLDAVGFKTWIPKGSTAADRGSDIHDAVREYLTGGIVTDWIDQVQRVREFMETEKLVAKHIEAPACKEFPDIAGTADVLADCEGSPLIIDWKSGKPYEKHFWQVGLYCYIYNAAGAWLFYVDSGDKVFIKYEKEKIDSLLKWYYNKQTRGKE